MNFSKICKYIFYVIIFFTFYIVVKKLFQLLDIIDSDVVATPKPKQTYDKNAEIEKEKAEAKKRSCEKIN